MPDVDQGFGTNQSRYEAFHQRPSVINAQADLRSELTPIQEAKVKQWLQVLSDEYASNGKGALNRVETRANVVYMSHHVPNNDQIVAAQTAAQGMYEATLASRIQDTNLILQTYSGQYEKIVASGLQKPMPVDPKTGVASIATAQQYFAPMDFMMYEAVSEARQVMARKLAESASKPVTAIDIEEIKAVGLMPVQLAANLLSTTLHNNRSDEPTAAMLRRGLNLTVPVPTMVAGVERGLEIEKA